MRIIEIVLVLSALTAVGFAFWKPEAQTIATGSQRADLAQKRAQK